MSHDTRLQEMNCWRSRDIENTSMTFFGHSPISINWLLRKCPFHESESFVKITFQISACFCVLSARFDIWKIFDWQPSCTRGWSTDCNFMLLLFQHPKTQYQNTSIGKSCGMRSEHYQRQVMWHELEWPPLGLLKLANAHSSYQKRVRQCQQPCQKKAPFIIDNHEVDKAAIFK